MSNNLNTFFGRLKTKAKIHEPELYLAGGIITGIATVITASRATLKAQEILNQGKAELKVSEELINSEDPEIKKEYTEADYKNDKKIIYVQTGLKISKQYIVPLILGSLSLGCILQSHKIVKGRNVALAAAYTTLDKAFNEYRKEIKEQYGEDADQRALYGLKEVEVTEESEDEKGKKKTKKKKIEVPKEDYKYFFDESNSAFKLGDIYYNKNFLLMQQSYWNDMLRVNGYVTLNDVLTSLGFDREARGQVIGWVDDGSTYIDFGLHESYRNNMLNFDESKALPLDAYRTGVLLNFNVAPLLSQHLLEYMDKCSKNKKA